MRSPRVRAPGKAMLIGEYAVLDGGPAAVAAVDCFATATLEDDVAPASPFIRAAMQEVYATVGQEVPGVPVVDTTAFARNGQKLGLGSSAAATVAAVGALCAQAGWDVAARREEVRRIAGRAHDAAQGVRGSGADVLAASLGGVQVANAARPGGTLPVAVRLVATPEGVSTAALISRYREKSREAGPASHELAQAAGEFLSAWQAGEARALLAAVEHAFEGYLALGRALGQALVTPEHAGIQQAARRAGGAAKPSGAGGGDLAVVFLADPLAEAALAAWLPAGCQLLPFQISALGVQGAGSE